MRGPADESDQWASEPGGKVLRRLMHFLVRRGYAPTTGLTVQTFVAREADREAIRSRTRLLQTVPLDDSPASRASNRAGAQAIAEAYVRALQAGPPTTGPSWQPLGPITITNGQTDGESRVNVSGRVSAVAVDPNNSSHLLCGAAAGGVWESNDGGSTWAPRTDTAVSLAVGALAFDPVARMAYCGTGEGNWYFFLGAGLLKSADNGTTWGLLATDPFVGQGFYDLKIAATPANQTGEMYAANNFGLYVSHNSGSDWAVVGALDGISTWSISIAPGGQDVEVLAAAGSGLWRSTDRGHTWAPVSLDGAPSPFQRLAVAHAPSDPTSGTVYVFGCGPDNTAMLWARYAAGDSFAMQNVVPPEFSALQGPYNWSLAVAPDNSNRIFLGAIEFWRADYANANWTWTPLTNKGASGDSIHPDQHAIAFDPHAPDTIYVGNDGGLFRSPDCGVTWIDCNTNLTITEYEFIAQCAGHDFLVGGTQDNGTDIYGGAPTWAHVVDGDGGDCAISSADATVVIGEREGITPMRSTQSGAFNTWEDLALPVEHGDAPDPTEVFYLPFTACGEQGQTIALGANAVFVSRDNGDNWVRLEFSGQPTSSSAVYIPTPDDVLVGTITGEVYSTHWDGNAWGNPMSHATTPRENAHVSGLYLNPQNGQLLIAVYSTVGGGLVYVSSDGGASWTDCTGTLPGQPVTAVVVDPQNSNHVWIGTDRGVYASNDLCATWTNCSNGLPNALVADLQFRPDTRVLYAATKSRGVWALQV